MELPEEMNRGIVRHKQGSSPIPSRKDDPWLFEYNIKLIPVFIKSDKLKKQKRAVRLRELKKDLSRISPERPILFSAHTREGRGEVWARIEEIITG